MLKKKLIPITIMILIIMISYTFVVQAMSPKVNYQSDLEASYHITPDSNFFGEVEDQSLVDLPEDYENDLAVKGFKYVTESDNLKLYIKESYFNLAVYDKTSGYLWYSINPNYMQDMLVGTSRYFVESGVIIEYYNLDNISVENNRSYLSGPKYNVNKTYDYTENGLVAHIDFEDLGISFDVNIILENDRLSVKLPIDTLKEVDIEKTMLNLDKTTYQKITKYRLKSVYLFPYFGSNNYEINGYSLVPDGSGALIRYNDEVSSTAYIKRVYGKDEGTSTYRESSSTSYIREEMPVSMPIFGVNHGYHQAAFLAVVSQGDGYSEIHSYPYGYNAYRFNTTFAKFIVRERFTIQTSGNDEDSFTMINTDPYPTDFEVDYYFLNGAQASYSGMAKKYSEVLNLQASQTTYKTNITVIGQDYKSGLFGKNFVEMTRYDDVVYIAEDLKSSAIENLQFIYQAWNKGGLYDNTPYKPKTSSNLGGGHDFTQMNDYLKEQAFDIYYLSNPLVAYNQGIGKSIVMKTTLSTFKTNEARTSLIRSTYFLNPANVADTILKYNDHYSNLGIDSLALSSVGDNLFSYRYGSNDYDRNQMISILMSEMNDLSDYRLALYSPNAYLWAYLTEYLASPIESNKYAYVTDSIPFIQLVLSGSVSLSSDYINYVSDYHLFALRLIEYGINPSFLITQEPTYKLRYTNSEHIYTSEYALWKTTILDIDHLVSQALVEVEGSSMVYHRYIASGVAEITYDNGKMIYVNYQNEDFTLSPGVIVPSSGYLVVPS